MSDYDPQEPGVTIYVLPSEDAKPPRAVVGVQIPGGVMGTQVRWDAVRSEWLDDAGDAVPEELGEAITAHALSLGVPIVGASDEAPA